MESITESLLNFDIIYLQEIKTSYPFSLAGFSCIRSKIIEGEELRGGVAVLIKNYLFNTYVYDIDELRDQVWFRLHHLPDLLFGAIYVPPHDSPYFSHISFAYIQEKKYNNPGVNLLLIGDLNARIGSLDSFHGHGCRYSFNPDEIVNNHGRIILDLSESLDLKPLNHLRWGSMEAGGGRTYRQGVEWKSQIDWAFCSKEFIPSISNFYIGYNFNFPSNHAPIVVEIDTNPYVTSEILDRSKLLVSEYEGKTSLLRKPVIYNRIDPNIMTTSLPDPWSIMESTDVESFDINYVCSKMVETLYDISQKSCRPPETRHREICESKWK